MNLDLRALERRSREAATHLSAHYETPTGRARFRAKYGEDPSPDALAWLGRVAVADDARRSARAAWSSGRCSYRVVRDADNLFNEAAEGFRRVVGVRPYKGDPQA